MADAPPVLPRWRPRQPLEAAKLDLPNRAIERLERGLRAGAVGGGAGVFVPRRFVIDTIAGDYLECTPVDGTASVLVARPPMLRTSLSAHNGVSFSYPSHIERTATDSPDSEDQVIVPAYVVGDEVLAVFVLGGTGVDDGGSPAVAVYWLDLNCDARAWAALPAEA